MVAMTQTPSSAKSKSKQGTLSSYFSASPSVGKRKKPVESEEDDFEESIGRSGPKNKSNSTIDGGLNVRGPMDMRHLPPISDLNEMFADLVDNSALAGIQDLLDRLDGRKLRVATMCSGTESPLLVYNSFFYQDGQLLIL